MFRDPIVEEVHQIRAEIAAQFNFDLEAMAREMREKQEASGRVIIRMPTRPANTGSESEQVSE